MCGGAEFDRRQAHEEEAKDGREREHDVADGEGAIEEGELALAPAEEEERREDCEEGLRCEV
jgi:hypothetical protein